MYKNTSKKAVVKNPRLYFITNDPEEDFKKLEENIKKEAIKAEKQNAKFMNSLKN